MTGPAATGLSRSIVHLVHGWPPWSPAGTETYARALALAQAERHRVAVHAREADPSRPLGAAREVADGGARVRLVVNNFTQRDPLSRNALHDTTLARDFAAFLDETRPDLVHVHHLAGHCATLPRLARARGVPVVVQLQDWWAPCARVNLLDRLGRRCPGPSPLRCALCQPLTRIGPVPLASAALHALRASLMRRALEADRLLSGSRFIAESYRELGWLPGSARIEVVPYGVPRLPPALPQRPDPPGLPLRFGFIGSLMPHKGAHVAVEAFRGLPPSHVRLLLWGDPAIDPPYVDGLQRGLGGADVALCGRFEEARKPEVFAGLDVLLVPSIGLESYGIVVDEAMAHGVPVVASRDGALPDRYTEAAGAFVRPGDAAALRELVLRLAAEPGLVAAWRRQLPRVSTLEESARRVETVYEELLSGGPAARTAVGAG